MKLSLNIESAQALRTLADALSKTIVNVEESTKTLKDSYMSVQESLGEHADDFGYMIEHVNKAKETAAEAIEALPPKMRETAGRIDNYVQTHPAVSK